MTNFCFWKMMHPKENCTIRSLSRTGNRDQSLSISTSPAFKSLTSGQKKEKVHHRMQKLRFHFDPQENRLLRKLTFLSSEYDSAVLFTSWEYQNSSFSSGCEEYISGALLGTNTYGRITSSVRYYICISHCNGCIREAIFTATVEYSALSRRCEFIRHQCVLQGNQRLLRTIRRTACFTFDE